ncbi:MAG: carboxypeptidase-like regulatory domain-containing protein [Chitinophagaceae bacterium]|jgi:hypothetical protein
MKKQNPIILTIPQPCHENWGEMTVVDKGRFCSHCQKTVTDLTWMSDAAIVQLFQQQSASHCIRAFSSQLNRTITLPPQAPTRFYRIAVALGLTIMMAGAADAYARPKAPLVEQNYLLDTGDSTKKETGGGDSITISGVVVDETGAAFGGVIVKVMQGGLLKSGTITEDDGTFSLMLFNGNYELEFSSSSYKIEKYHFNKKTRDKIISIKMSYDRSQIMGLLVIPIKKSEQDPPGRRTYTEDEIKKFGN